MTIPFESYAKLIRAIAPPVRKVLFYDGETHPAWSSDGMEEPELRSAVVLLMTERSRFEDDVAAFPIGAGDTLETFFIFAVRREDGILTGLLGVVCRNVLDPRGPGRSELTRRLLAPVLDVYRHSLCHSAPLSAAAPRIAGSITARPETPAAGDGAAFYDKVLRQIAADVECSFAAIVLPACGVSRYHRTSENECDVSIDAAVRSVHAAMFKWMAFRRQPTAINRTGGVNGATARYKIAAAPILDPAGQVLGLMLLFREPSAADFLTSDLECARAACGSLSSNASHHATRTPAQIRRALADGHSPRSHAQSISPPRPADEALAELKYLRQVGRRKSIVEPMPTMA